MDKVVKKETKAANKFIDLICNRKLFETNLKKTVKLENEIV